MYCTIYWWMELICKMDTICCQHTTPNKTVTSILGLLSDNIGVHVCVCALVCVSVCQTVCLCSYVSVSIGSHLFPSKPLLYDHINPHWSQSNQKRNIWSTTKGEKNRKWEKKSLTGNKELKKNSFNSKTQTTTKLPFCIINNCYKKKKL